MRYRSFDRRTRGMTLSRIDQIYVTSLKIEEALLVFLQALSIKSCSCDTCVDKSVEQFSQSLCIPDSVQTNASLETQVEGIKEQIH